MDAKYRQAGLQVLGVHTPKFDEERERAHVDRAAARYGLTHPIYLDNDGTYFDALGRAWRPVFFLVDRRGMIRLRVQGELREGTDRARQFESALRDLLAEDAS